MDLKHFSKTVVGLVRKANEDHIGSLTNQQTNGNGDIFVVCDGMGGHVGGAIASKTAVECILQYFKKETHPNPILALEKAISFANEQICVLSQNDPDLKGMGTTCTALLQKEDKVYIAHVGDSRIYLNTDNKLYRVTKDHSFVQKLVDAGQLEDSEMETHPRKNELTRALGISETVEVEISENPLLVKKGDKFLMCSDGLCGLVNDHTISYVINKESGNSAVDELIQLAENAGGNDNISVGIIEVESSPHLKTVFKDQTNKTGNLSDTQVLDVSSMKSDHKFIAILKAFKYYIISFSLLLLILIVILIPKSVPPTPTPTPTPAPVPGPIITISSIDTISPIEVGKEDEDDKKAAAAAKAAAAKAAAEAERIRIANLNAAEAAADKKAADKKAAADKKSEIKKLYKRIGDFIAEINSYEKSFKGTPISRHYNFRPKFKKLQEDFEKERIKDDEEIIKLENEWESIQKTYKTIEGDIISASIKIGKNLIEKLEKITNKNKVYSDYVSNQKKDLIESFKTNTDSLIILATKELKDIKKVLEDRIKHEKKNYLELERYKWDKKECGNEKPSHYGVGDLYKYEKGDKEINEKYLKEIREIEKLKKDGYELSDKKINLVKKDKEEKVISSWSRFFTTKNNNYSTKQINRLITCSGESKDQIYILKTKIKN